MSDFLPPTGPPPPKVPEGWKVQWNEQYSEWFFVNIYTKKSQWDKPTEPVYPQPADDAPAGPPPGYSGGSSNHNPVDSKNSNNPYQSTPSAAESDEALARRLQAEEDARVASTRGAQQDYMNTPMQNQSQGGSPYAQQGYGQQQQQPMYNQYPNELPQREQTKSKGGFLGKLMAKASGSGGSHGGSSSFRPPGMGGGYPQQHGYGQQNQYPQQGYGGGYGGGYPQQQGYPQQYGGMGGGYGRQPKKSGGGMGMAGGAALGLGGGLIGGAMLANAFDDDHEDYQEGYQDGMDNGGGDDGGGDDGGD